MGDTGRRPPSRNIREGSSSPPPRLRSLDVVRIVDKKHGFATLLRDGEGVGDSVMVPPPLDSVLAFMNGRRSAAEIAALASRRSDEVVDEAAVLALVEVLKNAFLLEDARFAQRFGDLRRAFLDSPVRKAIHAGGAYHADPRSLASFIDDKCIGAATEGALPLADGSRVAGLVAPHMDLWRAAHGYGRAYSALKNGLGERADTFVLLGTCHAGLSVPFSITRKAFDTPFGEIACAHQAIDDLAARSRFDVFADQYQHEAEHSIEFQAVFLRHLLGEERARASTIVPILCGLGRSQASRSDPADDAASESFIDALVGICGALGERVVVIAGADLAHMGPRFGDAAALDAAQRTKLGERDGETIQRARDGDASGFFAHTTEDQERRRVCGVGPIYTLLRTLPALGSSSALLHNYAQHIDPDEGSIVSHASVSFAVSERHA